LKVGEKIICRRDSLHHKFTKGVKYEIDSLDASHVRVINDLNETIYYAPERKMCSTSNFYLWNFFYTQKESLNKKLKKIKNV